MRSRSPASFNVVRKKVEMVRLLSPMYQAREYPPFVPYPLFVRSKAYLLVSRTRTAAYCKDYPSTRAAEVKPGKTPW